MPILVTVLPAVLKAQKWWKIGTIKKISNFRQGGGSGPKHSAFCGACFSINSYRTVFGQKCQKWGPKNHEPSVFFNRPKMTQKVEKCQKSSKIDKFGSTGFFNNSRPNWSGKFYRDPLGSNIFFWKWYRCKIVNGSLVKYILKKWWGEEIYKTESRKPKIEKTKTKHKNQNKKPKQKNGGRKIIRDSIYFFTSPFF
jgi:hypothetical protein